MNIVLDNVEYPIKDLTLEQYDIVKQSDKLGDAQVISLFTGIAIADIKQAPFTDVKFVANMLRNHLLDLEDQRPLELTYTHKGKNYGLIIPTRMSFEEWINMEVFMAQKPLDLPLIAAHLYKPLKEGQGQDRVLEKYDMTECQNRAQEDFKDFPISVFVSALFFFSSFVMEYTKSSLSSLETRMTGNQ